MKKHIEALIERQENAFISSVDGQGFPIVKIVNAPRKRDGIETMYFTTPCSTKTVEDYTNNNKATVYFVDKSRFQTALFIGTMTVETDEAIREELKKEEHAKIFANGIVDANYCVLKFTATSVRFFSNLETTDIAL